MSDWLWQQTAAGPSHGHQVPCYRFPHFVVECSHMTQLRLDLQQFSWQVTENVEGNKSYSFTAVRVTIYPFPLWIFYVRKIPRAYAVCFSRMLSAHVSFCLMENQDINLFTGRPTSSKKLQGREMQWDHDFHRLMWCRTILNLLKTSLSVKISIFHVHQGPPCSAALGGAKSKVNPVYIMYFAFCTLQCYVPHVQDSHRWLSSPYYENSSSTN